MAKTGTEKKDSQLKVADWEDVNGGLLVLRVNARVRAERNAEAEARVAEIQRERDEAVAPLDSQDKEIARALELFVIEHRADLGERQTMELTNGQIGFRATPPKVAPLNKKWNVDRALEAMRTKATKWRNYIRTTFAIDKDAILVALRAERPAITDEDLAVVGLRVQRGENFVCEPKSDEAKTGAN